MHRLARLLPLLALFALGGGCLPVAEAPTKPITEVASLPAPESAASHWTQLADGAARVEVALHAASTGTLVLYRFSPQTFQVRLRSATLPQVVSRWSGTGTTDRLVVNGVYFNEDFTPSGLVIKNGARQGTRQFDLDRSGILQFSPTFRLIDSATEPVELANAAQSYPFLVLRGEGAIAEDSHQLARRTVIGQDRDGLIYIGVVANDEISLHGLMQVLLRTGIAWSNVLNLDGGPSTGLDAWIGDWQESRDSLTGVPSVVVVERKS
jgi:uncharacterized protein YigE (DUF2233 family)